MRGSVVLVATAAAAAAAAAIAVLDFSPGVGAAVVVSTSNRKTPTGFLGKATLGYKKNLGRTERALRSLSRGTQLLQSKSGSTLANATVSGFANLTNVADLLYTVEVSVGSNQVLVMDLDTGSSDTWGRGAGCFSPDSSCAVGNSVNISDPLLLPTNDTFDDLYGSGEALGNVFTAPVTLGGLTAKIGFGVTTAEVGFTQMDGLLGLAFTSLNVINNGNWFDKLGLKGEQNRFGFYLSVSDDGDFGEVALGGQDATKFTGPINWHPLVEQLWWEFDFTATYKVGGIKGSVALTAIADTGTTLIILDSVTANDINAGIGAHFDINQGLYVIDCAKKGTTPNVTLAFGGYEYVLPSSRYIIQDGDACFSGFAPGAGNGVPVILGDVFLRVYYSVYDKEGGGRVGFAEAVHPGGFGDSGPTGPETGVGSVQGSVADGRFLTYHGGPVIGNVTINPIFIGDVAFQNEITSFYKYLVQSDYMVVLKEYNASSGSLGSIYRDPDVAQFHFGVDTPSVYDEVGQYLNNLASKGLIAPSESSFYYVHFPPGVEILDQSFDICFQFCYIHAAFITELNTHIYFTVVPDVTDQCNCLSGLSSNFDSLTYAVSGLLAQGVTDPLPGTGWFNDELAGAAIESEQHAICNAASKVVDQASGTAYVAMTVYSTTLRLCTVTPAVEAIEFMYPYGGDSDVSLVNTAILAPYSAAALMHDWFFTVHVVAKDAASARVQFSKSSLFDGTSYNEEEATLLTKFAGGQYGLYALTWNYGLLGTFVDTIPETTMRALMLNDAGTRIFDLNDDYWVLTHATQDSPLLDLGWSPLIDANGLLHIKGSVKTLGFKANVDFLPGTVQLNYTTDSGASYHLQDLVLRTDGSKTWDYDLNLGVFDATLPDSFNLRIVYKSTKGEFSASEYSGNLRPKVTLQGDNVDFSKPFSGRFYTIPDFSTIVGFPVQTPQVAIDGIPLAVSFFQILLDTDSLAEGAHELTVTKSVGAVQATASMVLHVSHRVSGKTRVRGLQAVSGAQRAVAMAARAGTLYVAFDAGVAYYNLTAGATYLGTLAGAGGAAVVAVGVDGAGRVYALDKAGGVTAWDDVGGSGSALPARVGAVAMAVAEDGTFWFLSSAGVAAVAANGTEIGNVQLPGGYAGAALALDPASRSVVVATQSSGLGSVSIVTINAASFVVDTVVPVNTTFLGSPISSIAVVNSSILLSSVASLYVVDRSSGSVDAVWWDQFLSFSALLPTKATTGGYKLTALASTTMALFEYNLNLDL